MDSILSALNPLIIKQMKEDLYIGQDQFQITWDWTAVKPYKIKMFRIHNIF